MSLLSLSHDLRFFVVVVKRMKTLHNGEGLGFPAASGLLVRVIRDGNGDCFQCMYFLLRSYRRFISTLKSGIILGPTELIKMMLNVQRFIKMYF